MLLGINSLSLDGRLRPAQIFIHNAHIGAPLADTGEQPMRYNELKTVILHVLTTEGWRDSNQIMGRVQSELERPPSPRAVRMALLRYHRYGLLHREWRRGEYVYRLSDRGARRLVWLRGLATDSEVSIAPTASRLSGTDSS